MDYDGRNKYSSIDSIKEESKNADVKQPRKRNHNAFGGDSKENTNNTSTSKENCFIKKEGIL